MSDGREHPDEPRRRSPSRRETGRRASPLHVDDLAAAYALGALEPVERVRVENHCRGCGRCAQLVAANRRAVAPLGLLAPPAAPRPEAKAALLARVAAAQAASVRPAAPRAWLGRPAPRHPEARPPQAAAPPLAAPSPPRWFPVPFAVSRSVALVLALALVGGWALHLKAPVDDRPTARLLPQTQAGSDHWGTAGETLIGSAGPAAAPRDRLMLSGVEPGTSRDVAPSAEGLGSGIGGGVALVTTGVLDPGGDDTP